MPTSESFYARTREKVSHWICFSQKILKIQNVKSVNCCNPSVFFQSTYKTFPPQNTPNHKTFPTQNASCHKTFPPQYVSFTKRFLTLHFYQKTFSSTKLYVIVNKNFHLSNVSFKKCFHSQNGFCHKRRHFVEENGKHFVAGNVLYGKRFVRETFCCRKRLYGTLFVRETCCSRSGDLLWRKHFVAWDVLCQKGVICGGTFTRDRKSFVLRNVAWGHF